MRKIMIALTALLAFTMPAFSASGPKVPDQTIAKWTTRDAKDPDVRNEDSLTVHSGVLKDVSVLYTRTVPEGDKSSFSVRLSRIARITKDDTQDMDGTPIYRIGIEAKGKDIIAIGSGETDHDSAIPGFAVFGTEQQSQRDDALAKLCTLVPGACQDKP